MRGVGLDARFLTPTAGTGKGLSLELGGKSPYIVFEDADIDSAIDAFSEVYGTDAVQIADSGWVA